MNDKIFANRKTSWKPIPRAEWLTRINQEGDCLDLKSVVPLDADSLLATATGNTGLTDFGDESSYEAFRILTKSLDEEAELNLMGRLLTRSDLLNYLQGRLQIEDTYKRHPEIHDQEIVKPLYIIGQGRSGTTFMLNLLSTDPANGSPKVWEAMFPCPPPEAATHASDPRIDMANRLTAQFNRVIPEFRAMYDYSGYLPTEIAQLHCLSFKSSAWFNLFNGQCPSYAAWMQKQDLVPIYEYEKKVLKLLQWKNPRKHWLLKSPECLMHIPAIRAVYPDACFIWPHRDPVLALSSAVDLVGTFFWAKSDHPFIGNTIDMFASADISAAMMSQPIEWIESGILPKEKLCNVQYPDFIRDPLACVAAIYAYFGIEMTEQGRRSMQRYLDDNPRSSRPVHHYETGDPAQVALERQAYSRYQRYFNVANEV